MNNAAKLLRVVSRLPAKRHVSTIRPKPDSVVYNGVTYTKMLYPHTLTSQMVNYHWKLYWQRFAWFRMIVYATILVSPVAIYTNYIGKPIDRTPNLCSSPSPVATRSNSNLIHSLSFCSTQNHHNSSGNPNHLQCSPNCTRQRERRRPRVRLARKLTTKLIRCIVVPLERVSCEFARNLIESILLLVHKSNQACFRCE